MMFIIKNEASDTEHNLADHCTKMTFDKEMYIPSHLQLNASCNMVSNIVGDILPSGNSVPLGCSPDMNYLSLTLGIDC